MRAQTFWKTVTADRSDFLGRLIALLGERGHRFNSLGELLQRVGDFDLLVAEARFLGHDEDLERRFAA